MANAIKYSALGTNTLAIAGDASTPTLKSLASNGRKLGSAIDLTAGGVRNQEANWTMKVKGAVSFSATGIIELYFIKSQDGTNYEYGDDSNDPPLSALVATFYPQASTSQQYVTVERIPLPNCLFKPLVYNRGGQAFSGTNDENQLYYRAYDPNEVQ